jgi:hypothetical protein
LEKNNTVSVKGLMALALDHLSLAPCGLQDSHILFVAHGQAENMKFEPQRRKGAEVAKPSVGENSFTGIGYE